MNLVIFSPQYIDILFETLHVFSRVCRSAHGLDMIFKFIFVTFSTLTLPLSEPHLYESVQTLGTF